MRVEPVACQRPDACTPTANITFVRHWSRRASGSDHKAAEQGRLVLVTEAVHGLTRRGIVATVNAVAHEIGVDQSGASRLVKSATKAGNLTMQPSPSDGR